MATGTLAGTPRGAAPGGRRAAAVPLRSRRQRAGLSLAIVILALATSYSSLATFARVYPALFPGQTLAGTLSVTKVVAPLPGLGKVRNLNPDSSFNERINVLVVGVDKRPQYTDFAGYLTDVIMVASLDPVSRKVNVISFPRDMLVEVHRGEGSADYYEDKINASYGVGFRAGQSFDAGARQLQRDMLENFGIETDHWVIMDFKGVEKLVDAVGGVDLDIPYELSVPYWYYSDDDLGGDWVSFPAGPQHLDGYHAVAFGRYRNDSDLYRVKRQQAVLEAGIAKLFSLGLLNNPIDLWDAYSSTVKTDISKARMLGLVPLFRQTQGRTAMYSACDPVDGRTTCSGMDHRAGNVQVWDRDNVRYWLDKAFPKVKYVGASVEIEDGYGGDGGARASALARYLLFFRNLPTVALGPDLPPQDETRITLYGDRVELAEDLRKWLSLPPERIRREPREADSTKPDVVIVIGRDFQIPNQ